MSEMLPPTALAGSATHAERQAFLADAHRALMRRQERRTVAKYRRALAETPGDVKVTRRLAPLLARCGDEFEARRLFADAGRQLLRARQYERALRVCCDSCRRLSQQFDAWRIRAEIEIERGQEDAALETLREGCQQFRSAHTRAQAMALLCMARTIDPWDPGIVLELARLYTQSDQAWQALDLLSALAQRSQGAFKRRVRAAQLRITWSPRHFWLWGRALWEERARSGEDTAKGTSHQAPVDYARLH